MTEVRKSRRMEKDRSEKRLEEYNDVFADISNHLVFEEPLICEEDLLPGPTESVYEPEEDGALKEQRRDVSKYVRNLDAVVALIGMENQTREDSDMGIRMLGYDYGSYRAQILTGKERYGVVSAVLYFGKEPWKKGSSLKGQLHIPKAIEPYVSDYSYHLIDVPRLTKSQRSKLTSDFKVVADFFAEKDQKDYRPSRQEIVHVKAVLRMLLAFTGDKRYQDIEEEIMENVERGEVITVCDFADRMEKQGVKQGVDEALQLAAKLAELGRTDDILKAAKDPEYQKKLFAEFGLMKAR